MKIKLFFEVRFTLVSFQTDTGQKKITTPNRKRKRNTKTKTAVDAPREGEQHLLDGACYRYYSTSLNPNTPLARIMSNLYSIPMDSRKK